MQAVVAGIEEFECNVIQCHMDELSDTLQKLQIRRSGLQSRAERGEVVQSWSVSEAPAGGRTGNQEGREGGRAKKHCGRRERAAGGGISGRGTGWSRRRRKVPPVVDVVAVCSLMRLMDYGDEARIRRPSARDALFSVSCFLRSKYVSVAWGRENSWCWSQKQEQPDIFVQCQNILEVCARAICLNPYTVPIMKLVFFLFFVCVFLVQPPVQWVAPLYCQSNLSVYARAICLYPFYRTRSNVCFIFSFLCLSVVLCCLFYFLFCCSTSRSVGEGPSA